MMDQLAKDFLDSFIALEDLFKKSLNSERNLGFTQSVHVLSRTNPLIAQYREDLIQFSQLRNAIVHERVNHSEVIATPHPDIVKKIEKIKKQLIDPKKMSDVSFSKFTSITMDTTVENAVLKMKETGFKVLPVFKDGQCQGLLTAKSILVFVMNHMLEVDKALKNNINHVELENRYLSVSAKDTIAQCINTLTLNHDLVAVLVEDGHRYIGLLTHKDLGRLMALQGE